MAGRHLLHLSHDGLVATHWQHGRLTDEACFADDPAGHAAFARYLAERPQGRFTLLADLADESFHADTLPALRGRDRRRLIARRQAQLGLDTPYVTHIPLGGEAAGSRAERILFVALTRPDTILPWLTALRDSHARLTGMHSAALLGAELLRTERPLPPRTLLVAVGASGLRISCLEHGRLRFSRLVRSLIPSSPALWDACHEEVRRTAHYLLGQRALEHGQVTPVRVLAHPDQHPAIRKASPDSPELHFTPIDLPGLASRHGLLTPHADSDPRPLLLHLAARSRAQAQFAPAGELRQQRVTNVGTLLGIASASLLSACLVVSARNLVDSRLLRQQAGTIHAAALAEETQRDALSTATPPLPQALDALQAALARIAMLESFRAGPAPFFRQLAHVLDTQPDVQLVQLDWAAAPPHQSVRIEAILPDIDAQAEAVARFLAALRQLPGAIVEAERLPAGLDDTSPLRAARPSSAPDRRLSVRATLPPPTR